MTDIMSEFVSHPSNVVALFSFLTYIVLTLKSLITTKMLLRSGKKHGTITKNRIEF